MKVNLNLSHTPFQNRNLLYTGIVLSLALALGLTSYNAWSSVSSWRRIHAIMSARSKTEWDSRKGREMAEKVRAEIEALKRHPELAQVSFVNRQVERGALSWVRLLDWIEATLPPGAILTSLDPSTSESGDVIVNIRFRARTLEAALTFMRRLHNSPAFPTVTPLSETTKAENGMVEYSIRAAYLPTAPPPPPPKGERAAPETTDEEEEEP